MDHVIFVLSPNQMSPLHWAADRGHVETVSCLIVQGAQVDSKDGNGVSEWGYTTDCGLVQELVNLVPKYLYLPLLSSLSPSVWQPAVY